MNSPEIFFEETAYSGFDTYKDIVSLPEFIAAVEHAVQFLEKCDQVFLGETYGDKLRFVFMMDDGVKEVLKHIRETNVFTVECSVKKMIALVLVVEDIKELVSKFPNTLSDIVQTSVLNIIDNAIGDSIDTMDEDENRVPVSLSKYERFSLLLEKGFPIITREGSIVMFYGTEETDGGQQITVWNDEFKESYIINQEGYEMENPGDSSPTPPGKKDRKTGKGGILKVISGGKENQ